MQGEAEAALAGLGLRPEDDAEVLGRIAADAERNGWHRLAKRARAALADA
jgi:hypothetical protein